MTGADPRTKSTNTFLPMPPHNVGAQFIAPENGTLAGHTHHCIPTSSIRSFHHLKAIGKILFVLLQLLIILPSVAFAFSPSASTGSTANDPPGALAQAGVSVVRLVVTYQVNSSSKQCTGLGVLIRSWTKVAGEATNNNWVLTDGSLFTQNSCNLGAPSRQPSGIQVFASTAFSGTATTSQPLLLGSLTNPAPTDFSCQATPCSSGAELFSFSTDAAYTLPYIDLAGADSNLPERIGLTNGAGTSPPSVISNEQQIQPFLTPNAVASQGNEAGTPLVDSEGNLVGMRLLQASTNLLSFTDLTNIVDNHEPLWQTAAHKNTLHDRWDKGIVAYYATPPDYTAANQAFQAAQTANPDFRAANLFQHLAPPPPIGAKATATAEARATATAQAGNGGNGIFPKEIFGIPIWLLSVAILLVLATVLILVSLNSQERLILVLASLIKRIQQRRREFAQFKADEEAARRRADEMVRQQQTPQMASPQQRTLPVAQPAPTINKETEQPAMQRLADVGQIKRAQPIPPVQTAQPARQQQPVPATPVQQNAAVVNRPNPTAQQPELQVPCPNCRQLVRTGARFCPNCRFVLSPAILSESRQSLSIVPSASPVPEQSSEKIPALSVSQVRAQQAPAVGTAETDYAKAIQARLRRLWGQAE